MSSSTNTNPMPGQPFTRKFLVSWKKFNHFLGNLIARLQLDLLYFTILIPFGIWTRLWLDPLDLRPKPAATYWHAHSISSSKSTLLGRE